MRSRKLEIKKLLAKGNKVLIYGAGEITKKVLNSLKLTIEKDEYKNIVGLIDSDLNKQGKYLENVIIYNQEMINQLYADYIIINVQDLSVSKEISAFISHYWLEEKIINLSKLCGKFIDTDELAYYYKYKTGGCKEVRSLKSQPYGFYPKRIKMNVDFMNNPRFEGEKITKQTIIASMGSCFSTEIKGWLKNNGYLYLETSKGPGSEPGSARYSFVYNTFTMLQEFERAFEDFNPDEKYWEFVENGLNRIIDPYRRDIAWRNKEDMEQELVQHQLNVKRCLLNVIC